MKSANVTGVARMSRDYPRSVRGRSGEVKIDRLEEKRADDLLAFARALDEEDLLFLRQDITQASVISELVRSQKDDKRVTLLADVGGRLAAFGSLQRQDLAWMRHLAEIRVIVGPSFRSHGLGSLLAKELFSVAQDLGLQKVIARMAREQRAAQQLFERLGFQAEALLADWVIDRKGRTHDLVVMTYDVTALTN